jgi:hypothetical protein
MIDQEQKSANRLAFAHYLRTGRRLTAIEWQLAEERKFNPYHDPEDGRFTFAPGGATSSASSASMASRPTNGGKPYPARVDFPTSPKLPAGKPRSRTTQKPPAAPPIRFEHRKGLDLSPQVIARANVLSESIHIRTGYKIIVTSGQRNEYLQEEAMYNNYKQGKPPSYVNRSAENEVHKDLKGVIKMAEIAMI